MTLAVYNPFAFAHNVAQGASVCWTIVKGKFPRLVATGATVAVFIPCICNYSL